MKLVLNRQKLYLEMNQSLHRKYEYLFHFFQVKWINDLLQGSHHTEAYQNFADMRVHVEDVEFLKRYYHHKTPTGKIEIQNRLKLCIQFYANNIAFMYQYPMMIVTNTKSLFIRRNKRIKKIQAGEGSSDETEQHQDENQVQEEHSSNFLNEMSRSSIGQEESLEKSSLSYESEKAYDIYDEYKPEQSKVGEYHLQKLNDVSESQVSHLFVDAYSSSQFKFDSQIPNSSKNTLNNIENQLKSSKESIISVVPIEEKLSIRSRDKRSKILSSYLDFMLDKQVSYTGLGFKFDNPAVNQYNNNHEHAHSETQSIDKQKEERASRRQKIREKAQELLKRVSKDEDVDQRY